mmetsp:Transcript_33592/g.53864  ORF Transcript_33592/g.53864 Transcript_33592/m.53864 type:complete len:219 (+) Transcript_33592:1136-1792(+)
MSAHPVMQDAPSVDVAPTAGKIPPLSPTPLSFPFPFIWSSSSPPGPVRRSGGPSKLPSPRLFQRKHVVPRKTKSSFMPNSSTSLPSTRHEMASMRTQGPCSATSSFSGRPTGAGLGLGGAFGATPLSSAAAAAAASAIRILSSSSALHCSGDLPPGNPRCPVHVGTTSPSPISRTRTRTTGFTSSDKNFSPGISSWNRLSSPGTRFITAPMGSSMPTY